MYVAYYDTAFIVLGFSVLVSYLVCVLCVVC
jgi:hypothetical protein